MFSIAQVLRQFKQRWTEQLDDQAIENACRSAGAVWRDRVLPPVFTIKLFLLQILHGNTACHHLPHLADRKFSGEAYCKARMRLPLAVLQHLLTACTAAMLKAARDVDGLWYGHRLWLVDGTGFSMPDTPSLQAHFGQPGGQSRGCGFPVAHCLALVHAASGLVQQLSIAPLRTHDMSLVAQLVVHFVAGDLVVSDRGLSSYAHFALLSLRGVFGLARAHQKLIVDFTPHRPHVRRSKRTRAERGLPYSRWVRSQGDRDQIVEWFRPTLCPDWMSPDQYAALPASLYVRELRYAIKRRGFRVREMTLVTTLLDPQRYPAAELAALYLRRWQIETDFAHLKATLGMDVLKCKTVEGVQKEATMFVLVYNLVRMVMREAARRQHVDVERISFIDALRWLLTAKPGCALRELVINPLRSGRYEPRVRKRRPKQFPVMKLPRAQLRKAFLQAN